MLIEYPLQIVVVDDDPAILDIIKRYLESDSNLNITTFEKADEAYNYILNNKVNILISDILMKEMYGDDLLRKVINLKQGIQVIMMTAKRSLINFQACHKAGAKCVMFKPIYKDDLKMVISKIEKNFAHWNLRYEEIVNKKR